MEYPRATTALLVLAVPPRIFLANEFCLGQLRNAFQVDYPTKLSKMQNVSDITLFVPQNFGADSTVMTYLGFKGEGTKARSRGFPKFRAIQR